MPSMNTWQLFFYFILLAKFKQHILLLQGARYKITTLFTADVFDLKESGRSRYKNGRGIPFRRSFFRFLLLFLHLCFSYWFKSKCLLWSTSCFCSHYKIITVLIILNTHFRWLTTIKIILKPVFNLQINARLVSSDIWGLQLLHQDDDNSNEEDKINLTRNTDVTCDQSIHNISVMLTFRFPADLWLSSPPFWKLDVITVSYFTYVFVMCFK